MWWRRVGQLAVVATTAMSLSGCVVFLSKPTAKVKKGSVLITVQVCASQSGGTPPPGSCTNTGNSKNNAFSGTEQVFLGFRVPKGSKAPASFTATTGPTSGQPKLSFTSSKSYAGQLQSLNPAGSGKEWVGYASQYFVYSSSGGQQNFTAKVTFGLPKGVKGTFMYMAVVGGRAQSAGPLNPKQSVNCKGSLTKVHLGGHQLWICVDDSSSFT